MTESNSEQVQLDADVASIGSSLTSLASSYQQELDALKAQIAANPGQPASAVDLSGLDALSTRASQMAAAVQTSPALDPNEPFPAGTSSTTVANMTAGSGAADPLNPPTVPIVDTNAQSAGSVRDETGSGPSAPTG